MKHYRNIRIFIMFLAVFSSNVAIAAENGITATRVQTSGPILDPETMFWNEAVPFTVTMLPQTITTPSNPDPAIRTLTVRAVHNGSWIGVLVEWSDATKSDFIVSDQFGDQAAVEFPVVYQKDELPSPMMGNPGRRVDIWQWRAVFQRDLDEGEPSVRDLYPNMLVDVYPDEMLRATDARPYMGAVGVDNLISHPHGTSPVLQQMAEGFGTLTAVPETQDADGRGLWKDGTWRVVFTHPLTPFSKNSTQFTVGGETVIAFAVWEGGHREVGPRKAWSSWVPFRLAQ
jgi:hypothetical protein